MPEQKRIQRALISVYYKDGLESLAHQLHAFGVEIYSTGGTRSFLEELGLPVFAVEDLTSYPSILGGRVKTLHPKVFGGILGRTNDQSDIAQLEEFEIPSFDLVMVDLYPFEETISSGASENEIIEKIDIGGVSLIRAAAKNFNDVLVVSSKNQYPALAEILIAGTTNLEQRRQFATFAFQMTSHYDTAISAWFSNSNQPLRYGENPHQKAHFSGNLAEVFTQLNGKELSYNNLLDIDSAVQLIGDFPSSGCAVIKHNNACGAALDADQVQAWRKALAGDSVSAFGGIFVFNTKLEASTATECDKLFFEVILAPGYTEEALHILKSKKNRIILETKAYKKPASMVRSVLNGVLVQEPDTIIDKRENFQVVTNVMPDASYLSDMEFASILAKHTKSNAIVLVKNAQLLANGTGQTSRIDAMHQAIDKAGRMGFTTKDSVLASDAFFPFSDSIELCEEAGIAAIIQPGGSVRDGEVIASANKLKLAMVFTGTRHFKH